MPIQTSLLITQIIFKVIDLNSILGDKFMLKQSINTIIVQNFQNIFRKKDRKLNQFSVPKMGTLACAGSGMTDISAQQISMFPPQSFNLFDSVIASLRHILNFYAFYDVISSVQIKIWYLEYAKYIFETSCYRS